MDMADVWHSHSVGDVKVFIRIFRQRVGDDQRVAIFTVPNLVFSEVLGTVQNALFRKALTALRLSSHHWKIEMGRWHKPHPIHRNDRLCQICNALEDEYHFICECPVYNEIRLIYISRYYRNR
ncbi:hypothetical protein LSH36_430g02000 [Paralvinella palmiformis]|uniref:Uncharacterized protein n=1 Tax=Paralvinella palmiformis TaxID=53620 RepID=A0AAD9JC20_9ANNE|nr:hypothetical protein LSH36_430g02000 [Paralvinella palmiformis]